jgi:peptide deformylase
MALLDIVTYPDPRLRQTCLEVDEVTPEIRKLISDMAETMYEAPGIGLAAPQVGSPYRIAVIDVGDDEDEGRQARLFVFINPEIVKREGKVDSEEGCLSIPSIRESITRSDTVTVQALDQNGTPFTLEATGILAICLQHEIDHLNGVLFIDHLSRLKRQLIKTRLNKLLAK